MNFADGKLLQLAGVWFCLKAPKSCTRNTRRYFFRFRICLVLFVILNRGYQSKHDHHNSSFYPVLNFAVDCLKRRSYLQNVLCFFDRTSFKKTTCAYMCLYTSKHIFRYIAPNLFHQSDLPRSLKRHLAHHCTER